MDYNIKVSKRPRDKESEAIKIPKSLQKAFGSVETKIIDTSGSLGVGTKWVAQRLEVGQTFTATEDTDAVIVLKCQNAQPKLAETKECQTCGRKMQISQKVCSKCGCFC